MSGYNESAYMEARETAIALPCPFERALLSHCVNCSQSRVLLLAEREAISCTRQRDNEDCLAFHHALHTNARFALHMDPNQPWPFGKEIRAQCGGILGLKEVLGFNASDDSSTDVAALISAGFERYGEIADFPYSEIMRGVVHYEPRKRREGK
jgi:hypothetical protein